MKIHISPELLADTKLTALMKEGLEAFVRATQGTPTGEIATLELSVQSLVPLPGSTRFLVVKTSIPEPELSLTKSFEVSRFDIPIVFGNDLFHLWNQFLTQRGDYHSQRIKVLLQKLEEEEQQEAEGVYALQN